MSGIIRVHKIVKKTESEGPGLRIAIWVQGCSIHCRNCYEKDTWDVNGGDSMSIDEIVALANEVEGITVLGGEPSEQAEGVAELLEQFKLQDKNCIVFSGHTLEELMDKGSDAIDDMLKFTDVLIDGGFDEQKKELIRPMVGSSNQRFISLSDEGDVLIKRIKQYRNSIEIHILTNGSVSVNGMWKEGE